MLFLSYLWFKDDTPFNTWVCLPNSCPTISSVLPPNIPTLSPCFIYIYFQGKNQQVKGVFESTNPNLHLPKPWPNHPACGLNSCRRWIACSANSWNLPPDWDGGWAVMGPLRSPNSYIFFGTIGSQQGDQKIPWKKNQAHVATVNILYHTWDPMDKVYIQIFIPWWSLVNFDHHRSASNYWSLQKKTCGELNETWSQQNDSQ